MSCRSDPSGWLKGAAFGAALRLFIAGKPVPCPRPRVSRKGFAYYPKAYSDWRVDAQRQLADQLGGDVLEGPLTVAIEARADRPKVTKLVAPRGDVDNFGKSALDILTKVKAWLDDSQVGTLLIRKRWADTLNPAGVNIWIAPEGA